MGGALQGCSENFHEVETPGRRKEKKVYHINLLKVWHTITPAETHAALFSSLPDQLETMPEEGEEAVENLFPSQGDDPQDIHLVAPVRQKSYRIPYSKREVVREELDHMLQNGVIQPSTSPWASPIVLVQKKDGGVRFCVDYRKLNAVAKFDAYPMPRVEEIFEQIGRAEIISTLDLAKGYWQIPMSAESKERTAFTTPFGLYEFQVMPFGLHNAPATFQRLMNHILRGSEAFAGVYIDDIVVFSQTWEEHLRHLRDVFSCLQ